MQKAETEHTGRNKEQKLTAIPLKSCAISETRLKGQQSHVTQQCRWSYFELGQPVQQSYAPVIRLGIRLPL